MILTGRKAHWQEDDQDLMYHASCPTNGLITIYHMRDAADANLDVKA